MLAIFLFVSSAVAQERTMAIGSGGPAAELPFGGTLRYDLHFAQTGEFGAGQGNQEWSFISGDANYVNTEKLLPFSLQYGGGYGRVWTGSEAGGNIFEHLTLSQALVWRKWKLAASDSVSDTYQTATVGFTGIPGTGSPIGTTDSPTQPGQTILALNTRTVTNSTTVDFTDQLDSKYMINLDGSAGEMRFIDNNGENTDTLTAGAGVTRNLNRLNSVKTQYSFSRYSYSGTSFSTQISSATIGFTREWNRRLKTIVMVGPQWISSSGGTTTGTASANVVSVPSMTVFSAMAVVDYQLRRGIASANYFRGSTGGSGYMLGAEIDNAGASYTQQFGRNITVGATGSYLRTASLEQGLAPIVNGSWIVFTLMPIGGITNAEFGGVQATRQVGRYLSFFANYTAIAQSSSVQVSQLAFSANLLQGVNQVIGFGFGYTPREKRFKK
ncbi:MAG: hypothetical protein ABR907_05600 [Terracidiphilus sp.]